MRNFDRSLRLTHRGQPVELTTEYDNQRCAKDERCSKVLSLENLFIQACNNNNFQERNDLAKTLWSHHRTMAYQSLQLNTQTAVYLLITCPDLIASGNVTQDL